MLLALAVGGAVVPRAGAATVVRITTENVPEHVHTIAVARFAQGLATASGGGVVAEHHPEGRLSRDRDAVRALQAGLAQMAVPGMWQLDRFEPHAALLQLPAFYGLSAAQAHAIADSDVGQRIAVRIGSATNTVVPGRWLDLGAAGIFTATRPVVKHEDLQGLRIRVAGGEGNLRRLRLMGADPVIVAWPDLPGALERGLVDGVLTTEETVASARLWERGIRHAFLDRQYFAQYVPLVSDRLWQRLAVRQRDAIVSSWESIVGWERAAAAAAQEQAARTLEAAGVSRVTPGEAQIVQARDRHSARALELAEAMGLDRGIVAAALERVGRRAR